MPFPLQEALLRVTCYLIKFSIKFLDMRVKKGSRTFCIYRIRFVHGLQ
jgi:hypothetical protein